MNYKDLFEVGDHGHVRSRIGGESRESWERMLILVFDLAANAGISKTCTISLR